MSFVECTHREWVQQQQTQTQAGWGYLQWRLQRGWVSTGCLLRLLLLQIFTVKHCIDFNPWTRIKTILWPHSLQRHFNMRKHNNINNHFSYVFWTWDWIWILFVLCIGLFLFEQSDLLLSLKELCASDLFHCATNLDVSKFYQPAVSQWSFHTSKVILWSKIAT